MEITDSQTRGQHFFEDLRWALVYAEHRRFDPSATVASAGLAGDGHGVPMALCVQTVAGEYQQRNIRK